LSYFVNGLLVLVSNTPIVTIPNRAIPRVRIMLVSNYTIIAIPVTKLSKTLRRSKIPVAHHFAISIPLTNKMMARANVIASANGRLSVGWV